MKLGDNRVRGRKEDIYDVETPDRHSSGGEGTTPHGVPVHGSHKQSWVEHDGIKPDPTSDTDGGGKDVG